MKTFCCIVLLSISCSLQAMAQHPFTRTIGGHELTYFQRKADTSYTENNSKMVITNFDPVITRLDGDSVYFNLMEDLPRESPYIDSSEKRLSDYFIKGLQPVAAKQLKDGWYAFGLMTVLIDKNGKIAYSKIQDGQAVMNSFPSGSTSTISQASTNIICREIYRLLAAAGKQAVLADKGKPVPYELDYQLMFALKNGRITFPVQWGATQE